MFVCYQCTDYKKQSTFFFFLSLCMLLEAQVAASGSVLENFPAREV